MIHSRLKPELKRDNKSYTLEDNILRSSKESKIEVSSVLDEGVLKLHLMDVLYPTGLTDKGE